MSIKKILEENFNVTIDSLEENLLEVSGFDSMNVIEFITILEGKGIILDFDDILEAKNLKELEDKINE